MDIQQYIALDKELLLNLNGSNSLFWDGFMWVATSTYIWIPTAIILLYITHIFRCALSRGYSIRYTGWVFNRISDVFVI